MALNVIPPPMPPPPGCKYRPVPLPCQECRRSNRHMSQLNPFLQPKRFGMLGEMVVLLLVFLLVLGRIFGIL